MALITGIECNDLFGYPDRTAVAPAETDANRDALRTFRSHAKKAWTYICLAVEPEKQMHIRDTKTAKEARDALKVPYSWESVLQKVWFHQQCYSL